MLFQLLSIITHTICFAAFQPVNPTIESIRDFERQIRQGDFGKITAIVAIDSHNHLVYEKYFDYRSRETLRPISSVAKSITSLMIGKCIDMGIVDSIQTPIYTYFPEYSEIFDIDTLKKLITIEDLLKQTSGLQFNEWRFPYNYASNSLMALLAQKSSWLDTFFTLPIDTLPGTKFSYNSLATQVLAEIVSRSSGMAFHHFVEQHLFNPLGIKRFGWECHPGNPYPAWGGISLTTLDMAKIGLIILNKGQYHNRQIVSEQWINRIAEKTVRFNRTTRYGLHWWVDSLSRNDRIVYAAGYGDQYIFVSNSKGLVICINANNFTDYRWPKSVKKLAFTLLKLLKSDSTPLNRANHEQDENNVSGT